MVTRGFPHKNSDFDETYQAGAFDDADHDSEVKKVPNHARALESCIFHSYFAWKMSCFARELCIANLAALEYKEINEAQLKIPASECD